jgi:hypothetical protein
MTLLPDFDQDVFLCFADEDNVPLSTNSGGWVDNLATLLTKLLGMLGLGGVSVRTALAGNVPGGEQIQALERSATVIVIASPALLASSWMQQDGARSQLVELARRWPQRVILVIKSEVEEEQVPSELWALKYRNFWRYEYGAPLTLGQFNPEDVSYLTLVNDVAHALAKQLHGLRGASSQSGQPPRSKGPVVFLAEVPPQLEDMRAAVERFLEQCKIEVRPRGHLPTEARRLQDALAQELQQSDVFVQLLGSDLDEAQPGSKTRRQLETALTVPKLKILQWRDHEVDLTAVPEGVRGLLEAPTVRAESMSDFQQAVVDASKVVVPGQPGSVPMVFIDAEPADDAELHKLFGGLCDRARWDWHDAKKLHKIKNVCDVADGVLVFWGNGESDHSQERYYQFLKYWRAKRKLERHLRICDGPPPGKPKIQGAGLPVVECRDGSRSALLSFVDELLRDGGQPD